MALIYFRHAQQCYGAGAGAQQCYGAGAGAQQCYGAGAGAQQCYGAGAGAQQCYGAGAGAQQCYGAGAGIFFIRIRNNCYEIKSGSPPFLVNPDPDATKKFDGFVRLLPVEYRDKS